MNETKVVFHWEMLFYAIIVLTIVSLIILLLVIPVKMANKRGRSGFGWFLFCLFLSPFLAMLFLAVLGETDEKRKERIIEEEKIRNRYRNPVNNNSESDLEKWLKENTGKSVNDYYSNR